MFPVFYSGGYEILIRVYGEDKDKIFNNLNFPPLYNITESDMIEIDRFEKEIGVIIIIKMVDYLKKALIYGHTSRISSWIYYQFTTFEGKSFDMPPGTLPAQPPAHSIEKE